MNPRLRFKSLRLALVGLTFAVCADDAWARPRRQQEPPPVPQRPALTNPAGATQSFTPGSLWTEPSGRQLMGLDGNARQVGDLITIRIREHATTALDASTSTAKDSTANASVGALLGVEQTLLEAHPRMGGRNRRRGRFRNEF